MDDGFAILAMFILICAGVFVGKLMDVTWRVWFLRQTTKVDYHVLAFATKDKKNIMRYAVNPEHDVFIFRGMLFHLERGRVYRETKLDDGLQKKDDKGWLVAKAPKTTEEGVPVIYCNADSMRPMVFENHSDPVKPSEAGTVFTAWIENQINKNFEQRDKIFMLTCLCLGLLVLNMILIYLNGQAIDSINTRLYPIEYKLGVRVVNATTSTNASINVPT